eukprot:4311240-Karenia_brevis.AAC.1
MRKKKGGSNTPHPPQQFVKQTAQGTSDFGLGGRSELHSARPGSGRGQAKPMPMFTNSLLTNMEETASAELPLRAETALRFLL